MTTYTTDECPVTYNPNQQTASRRFFFCLPSLLKGVDPLVKDC